MPPFFHIVSCLYLYIIFLEQGYYFTVLLHDKTNPLLYTALHQGHIFTYSHVTLVYVKNQLSILTFAETSVLPDNSDLTGITDNNIIEKGTITDSITVPSKV